jgi:hypothetical protein
MQIRVCFKGLSVISPNNFLMKAKFLFYKFYRGVRDISLVKASPAVRGILHSQKVQFFILAIHFLMPTLNSLFHSLLFFFFFF